MKKSILKITAIAVSAAIISAPLSIPFTAKNMQTAHSAETGYAADITPTVKYYVKADKLNVRCGPDTSYTIIGTLARKQKIHVKSISSGWAEFKFQGYTAYVSSKYLTRRKKDV